MPAPSCTGKSTSLTNSQRIFLSPCSMRPCALGMGRRITPSLSSPLDNAVGRMLQAVCIGATVKSGASWPNSKMPMRTNAGPRGQFPAEPAFAPRPACVEFLPHVQCRMALCRTLSETRLLRGKSLREWPPVAPLQNPLRAQVGLSWKSANRLSISSALPPQRALPLLACTHAGRLGAPLDRPRASPPTCMMRRRSRALTPLNSPSRTSLREFTPMRGTLRALVSLVSSVSLNGITSWARAAMCTAPALWSR